MRQNATLQAVVDHYAELLDFLSARTGSRDQARDCAQETWVRLAQTTPAPVKTGVLENVKAYVFRVAERIAIDHHRHAARQGRLHSEFGRHGRRHF